MISFELEGSPVPKERPRKGKHGNFYTPERTKTWENLIGWAGKGAMLGIECFPAGTDFEVWIEFRLPNDGRKRDIDNLSKSVLDGLNKIIWDDDTDITRLHLSKVVSMEPGISVRVRRN